MKYLMCTKKLYSSQLHLLHVTRSFKVKGKSNTNNWWSRISIQLLFCKSHWWGFCDICDIRAVERL